LTPIQYNLHDHVPLVSLQSCLSNEADLYLTLLPVCSHSQPTRLGIAQKAHPYIGDLQSVSWFLRTPDNRSPPADYLGAAPDPNDATPFINPAIRASVFLSGLAWNRDKDAGSCTLDINVWVIAFKDSATPSFKPTASFRCTIPDSRQYKTSISNPLQPALHLGLRLFLCI